MNRLRALSTNHFLTFRTHTTKMESATPTPDFGQKDTPSVDSAPEETQNGADQILQLILLVLHQELMPAEIRVYKK